MTILANVAIENGVYISSYGYITVVVGGEIIREYCTPSEGAYIRYWRGEGNNCRAVQEFTRGKTDSSGWCASARTWPSDDKIVCARGVAKRWRLKLFA